MFRLHAHLNLVCFLRIDMRIILLKNDLQELMERAVVLTQGGGQPQASPALGDLVAQYSTILASQVCTICTACVLRRPKQFQLYNLSSALIAAELLAVKWLCCMAV